MPSVEAELTAQKAAARSVGRKDIERLVARVTVRFRDLVATLER